MGPGGVPAPPAGGDRRRGAGSGRAGIGRGGREGYRGCRGAVFIRADVGRGAGGRPGLLIEVVGDARIRHGRPGVNGRRARADVVIATRPGRGEADVDVVARLIDDHRGEQGVDVRRGEQRDRCPSGGSGPGSRTCRGSSTTPRSQYGPAGFGDEPRRHGETVVVERPVLVDDVVLQERVGKGLTGERPQVRAVLVAGDAGDLRRGAGWPSTAKAASAVAELSLLAMVLLMIRTRVASASEMPPPATADTLFTMMLLMMSSAYQLAGSAARHCDIGAVDARPRGCRRHRRPRPGCPG